MSIDEVFARDDVDRLTRVLVDLDSYETMRAFLADLCTKREICDFAQRLQVARYLDEGFSYMDVQARTGVSSTTVSRVSKALNGAEGGYRHVLLRLEDGTPIEAAEPGDCREG